MLDITATLATHRAIAERFADCLAAVQDGSVRVPHLDWTISELGAHVLSAIRAYERAVHEDVPMWPDARDGAGGNRALIDATPERAPVELAAAIRTALDALHNGIETYAKETVAAWGNIRVAPVVLPGMHVGDIAVHGWDLSRATKTPWRIERSEALTTLEAMFRVIPHYVNEDAAAGLRATYALKLRGGLSWTATFDDGTLQVAEGSPVHADCRLLNDPVSFLLLAYQRIPLWKAAATGRSIAYGRKPWLAFKFADLVATP